MKIHLRTKLFINLSILWTRIPVQQTRHFQYFCIFFYIFFILGIHVSFWYFWKCRKPKLLSINTFMNPKTGAARNFFSCINVRKLYLLPGVDDVDPKGIHGVPPDIIPATKDMEKTLKSKCLTWTEETTYTTWTIYIKI